MGAEMSDAHLADSGDVQPDPADVAEDEREAETRLDSEEAEFLGFYRPKTRERRSGGDGR